MKKTLYLFVFFLPLLLLGQQKKLSTTKIKPFFTTILSDSIAETSGLLAFDGLLWTHNDDIDTIIYGLDTLGNIQKKIILPNVINTDWEEISQDEDYIYMGDFGNNYRGNRRDLKILKIEKNTFLEENPKIDTIAFSFENQIDFSPQKTNSTNFDCEAFIVINDSIYLFTKEWKNQKSSVYVLPNSTGNHIAKFRTSLNTKGLITGATLLPNKQKIVLCGYSKKGKPFLYIVYDFNPADFSKAKFQKIRLKLRLHQVEGIATFDGVHFYITNEKLIRRPILNVPQKLHKIDLSDLNNL